MRTTNRQFSFVGDIILMCKIALKSLVRFDNKLETLYFESRTSQAGLLIIISQSEKNIEMKIQQRDLSNFLNKKTSQLLYLVWVFCSKLVQKRGKFRITKNMMGKNTMMGKKLSVRNGIYSPEWKKYSELKSTLNYGQKQENYLFFAYKSSFSVLM